MAGLGAAFFAVAVAGLLGLTDFAAAFFAAGFDAGAADFLEDLPPKALVQLSAYFFVEPIRMMVMKYPLPQKPFFADSNGPDAASHEDL